MPKYGGRAMMAATGGRPPLSRTLLVYRLVYFLTKFYLALTGSHYQLSYFYYRTERNEMKRSCGSCGKSCPRA